MSDSERPDLAALRELEQLIRALSEEMAGWRRRAHEAESHLRELEVRAGEAERANGSEPDADRVADLEAENQALRSRLAQARERTQQLLTRLRFLRQQHGMEAER